MRIFPQDAILARVLNHTLLRMGRDMEARELMRQRLERPQRSA